MIAWSIAIGIIVLLLIDVYAMAYNSAPTGQERIDDDLAQLEFIRGYRNSKRPGI